MPVIIIAYDVADDKQRNSVLARIEKLQPEGTMRHKLSESAYLVAVDEQEGAIFESLKPLTEPGDELSVIAITSPGFARSAVAQRKLDRWLR